MDQLAEIIFCLENPPWKRAYISGTLDSRGIVGRGANLFVYASKQFFPESIETITDESTLTWLEEHIYLKHAYCRPAECAVEVRADHPELGHWCDELNAASHDCWNAIRRRDLPALADAVHRSYVGQSAIVENHCPPRLAKFIDQEHALGAMIMGAGGGGYVVFVAEKIPDDAIEIRIKRDDF